MRIAITTTDNREHYKKYDLEVPWLSSPIEVLLEPFQSAEIELHIVSCTRRRMRSPEKLTPNIFFHSLYVPKIGWMRTGYLGCIAAVRRRLKQIQPDLVHGQGTEKDCAMDAVFSGFPNVVTLHGNMVDTARVANARPGSFHWLAARLENLALRRTAGVLCNSQYTQALVRPRTRRTWLVPNALREVFFSKPRQPKQTSRAVLLHVGVVCENKQQLKALEMARSLHSRGLDFEMHFIGNASPGSRYVEEFMTQLRQAEQEGYARYLKSRSAEELVECLDQASALVHTPIAEAFGLVVAETLSRDLKFFGFDVGGVPDIAAGIDGAVLVTKGEWGSLENAIAAWFGQGRPAPRPSAEVMRGRYHPRTIAQRHVEIYREVVTVPETWRCAPG